jgi:hypothetical protein
MSIVYFQNGKQAGVLDELESLLWVLVEPMLM